MCKYDLQVLVWETEAQRSEIPLEHTGQRTVPHISHHFTYSPWFVCVFFSPSLKVLHCRGLDVIKKKVYI